MNTKKCFSFFLMFVVLALSSCSQDDDVGYASDNQQPKIETYLLSQDEAVAIAMDAVNGLEGKSTRNARALGVKSVERVPEQTRTDDGNEHFFYAVNFDGGGFAVVPNDKRATSVYALSDEGSFAPDANNGVKLYMDMAEDYLEYEISTFDTLKILDPKPIGGGYEKVPDPDDPRLYLIVYWGGEYCHQVVETTQSTPFHLLETSWGQDFPYNQECFTEEGYQAQTGCVATALGQIMAYHKQPQQYNGHQYYWDYMPKVRGDYDYSQKAYSVAYLINDIGAAVSMDYGISESLASSSKCPVALMKFGYNLNKVKDYSSAEVVSSLNLKRPVYIRGSEKGASVGHAWVIDGYYYIFNNYTYLCGR